ncbi:hypothetical protein Xen7305DRAFT_00001150 [Xenococcus sp. PCC 7305]|nr:hypothetical protein [Xenococcus sp. PCC 7305]ELS00414.1 hypothetical protein Xen7305DRAFT_00001150 [Xenococcus sp. PCC 7305]
MNYGLGMPWFEKLGLRLLFGLSMLKSLETAEENNLLKAKILKSQEVAKS